MELPKEGNKKISFKIYNRSLGVLFVIYADIEAFTEKVHNEIIDIDKKSSYTS